MGAIKRDFKGIWIPASIWERPDLSGTERVLLAEVFSLSSRDEGCTATNKYFSQFFHVSERTVSGAIASLVAKGLLKADAFDGRRRVLRVSPEVRAAGSQNLRGRVAESAGQSSKNCEADSQNFPNLLSSDKTEDKTEDKTVAPYRAIVDYLNAEAGRQFSYQTADTKKRIKTIWNNLPSLGMKSAAGRQKAFELVIDIKCKQWLGDAKFSTMLRPETLFRSFGRFEQYLNENPDFLEWARSRKND